MNDRPSIGGDIGLLQFETRQAFELPNGQLAGAAELGLTGLAQKLGFDHNAHVGVGKLGGYVETRTNVVDELFRTGQLAVVEDVVA